MSPSKLWAVQYSREDRSKHWQCPSKCSRWFYIRSSILHLKTADKELCTLLFLGSFLFYSYHPYLAKIMWKFLLVGITLPCGNLLAVVHETLKTWNWDYPVISPGGGWISQHSYVDPFHTPKRSWEDWFSQDLGPFHVDMQGHFRCLVLWGQHDLFSSFALLSYHASLNDEQACAQSSK